MKDRGFSPPVTSTPWMHCHKCVQGLFLLVLMAIKTYTEQLESVQATIEKIETEGQAYSMEKSGVIVTLTRANLKALYQREERLRTLALREQNGGGGIGVRYASPE